MTGHLQDKVVIRIIDAVTWYKMIGPVLKMTLGMIGDGHHWSRPTDRPF